MDKRNKNVTFSNKEKEENNLSNNKIIKSSSKRNLKDNYNKEIILSPKIYVEIQEELSKKKYNNLNINNLDKSDEEIKEIYEIYDTLRYQNKNNNQINQISFPLFIKTKMNEYLKSDLLFTGLDLNDLIKYINPFISLNQYNFDEFIYSYNESAENIYLILKGNIGLYKLVEVEEMFTSEQYYFYLYNKYTQYKQIVYRNNQDRVNNNEFIDIDSLIKTANNNKHIFPLYSLDDISELNKILLKIKLYIRFLENKTKKTSELFLKLNIPLNFLNYDKLIRNQISFNKFMEELTKNIKEREKFYMNYLGKDQTYKIKIIKFTKYKSLQKYDYFGNFEIIDTKPIRKDYALSENDDTILLTINKKEYSKIVNKSRKEKKKKEIEFLHNNFFFKTINKHYFETKIYIKFEIDQFFKGYTLSKQGEKLHNFIFIEEGVIQSSINDISLLELTDKIRALYDFIIKKAKELDEDLKTIIDFDTKLNQKTNLKYELIEETLKQKQNFTIYKTEKGMIGDYEYYFDIPSFITSTVISKNNRIFFYDFYNFKKVNDETHAFNDILKRISFCKLKSLLKRMISIYNSYFSFSIKTLENKINDNNKLIEEQNSNVFENKVSNNCSVENEKNFSSPFNVFRKKNININNFINTISEFHNSKYHFENQSSNTRNYLNNLYYSTKFDRKTITNLKNNHPLFVNENLDDNKKALNLRKIFNKKNLALLSINDSLNKSKEKITIKKLKLSNLHNSQNKKELKNDVNNNDDESKNKNEMKKQILNIFLPPLIENEKKLRHKVEHRNFSNNKDSTNINITKHALETINSINNTYLGHKDKNNLEELILTNFNLKNSKNSKKSKSIDIKKAQILLLKKRDKKAKLILQKKNELENFYEEDFF